MLHNYKVNPKDIRETIMELEKAKPKNIQEYREREDKIRKLLELTHARQNVDFTCQ